MNRTRLVLAVTALAATGVLGGCRSQPSAKAVAHDMVESITLPNGSRLHLPGKVAHLGPAGDGDVGVRFEQMSTTTRDEIKRYVVELSSGRTPAEAHSTVRL